MAQTKQVVISKDQSECLGKVVRMMISLGEKYSTLGRKIEYIKGPFLNEDSGENLFVIGYENKINRGGNLP